MVNKKNKSLEETTVADFINGKVSYDKYGGQYFWITDPKNGGQQMLAELRGWGAIQHMFKNESEAEEFQDKVGNWITDAINEKLERERK